MGFGQTMITVAFLVVLTLAVVSADKLIVDKDSSYYEEQAYAKASYYANTLLSEIISKKFDNNVPDSSSTGYQNDKNDFTTKLNLGPENTGTATAHLYTPDSSWTWWPWGHYYYFYDITTKSWANTINEKTLNYTDTLVSGSFKSVSIFNDVDDYNGYNRLVYDNTRLGSFNLSVKVYYVDSSNVETATTRNYLKRIEVTVSNPNYLTKSLTFSTLKAYTY